MSDSFVADIERDVVVVAGPDATSFLQSLVSQDLDPVAIGETVHALLLQPQGKLVANFRAARVADDTWWLVCDAGYGGVLAEALRRFKIRVDATVTESAGEFSAFVTNATLDAAGNCVAIVTDAGIEVVGPPSDVATARQELSARPLDARAYERLRIEAGMPRMGVDIDERTIPQEAELEVDAVSFTKGCFLGQELVCRIDTRGHVNRHLRRLRLTTTGATLRPGTDVEFEGRVVGAVTSASDDIGLAMLRREVEPGSVVTVGGHDALVEPLRLG